MIDIHCHTAGIGAGGSGCFISRKLRGSFRYGFYLGGFGVSERELQENGDALVMQRLSFNLSGSTRVSSAVILAMDAVVEKSGQVDETATEIFIPNRFVATEARRTGNLLFGASINPYRPDSLDRLEQASEEGAVLLKWLPPIQHIDPADKRIIPFYRRMKELGLPLLSHTGGERSFTRARNELGDPERLRLPLSLGVKVIAAHGGGNGRNQGESNFQRFLRLAREFPNLYADTAALTQINRPGQLARLLRCRELHGRLLHGSDMPLTNMCIVTPFAFPLRISPMRMFSISRIPNPWDRDVALKEALGLRREILAATEKVIRLT